VAVLPQADGVDGLSVGIPTWQARRQQDGPTTRENVASPSFACLPEGHTPDQLALLGTMPDADLARRIGRTVEAVCVRRTQLGIPSARDRRRRENR
jgi:hypothetical protein